ncbi:MAG TPA: 30S ribosomal protein S3 [Saccharofermentans sp.]|jgi:small subunit ribosomal protein S3|nr:30S ribosomal protein S3 [Clostridia bacterium]HOO48765.1 30S ribosomal protein S3 [Saccharofermentans sp.]HPJ81233.1 30S ribosomal protein S3 [Saccharofermentans sp.]HPM74826.1 30S ribosomal protein S3 [Saccharofermentans sp.]HPQ32029.1 30S ribosomal protein S3 [Saccharofermentans sp.]
MGQKVNPHGLRVGIIKQWDARWYADKKTFSDFLVEDKKIREFVKTEIDSIIKSSGKNSKRAFDDSRKNIAGVSSIEIERKGAEKTTIFINVAKPGLVIGSKGSGIEALKASLAKKFKKQFFVEIKEIKNADSNATLVAENIASQLENRSSFRRAMKKTMSQAMKQGILGIKTMCSGRLGGAEIARSETYHEGTIPLQTLRADIDYGFAEADTTYGRIGVKVWIFNGEVLPARKVAPVVEEGGEN